MAFSAAACVSSAHHALLSGRSALTRASRSRAACARYASLRSRPSAAPLLPRPASLPTPRATQPHRIMSSAAAKGTPLPMPALSPTMTSGKLSRWLVSEGSPIASGSVLAEIETDKATIDFVYQDEDACLAAILVPAGTDAVNVGTTLALLTETVAQAAAVKAAAAAATVPVVTPAAPVAAAPVAGVSSGSSADSALASLSASQVMPSARVMMANEGVHPDDVTTRSGKGGRITKGDVLQALQGRATHAAVTTSTPTHTPVAVQAAAPAPVAPTVAAAPVAAAPPVALAPRGRFTDSKPSTVRRVIAQRLTESKSRIPHGYTIMDVSLDALMALRATLKSAGIAVSVNDVIIAAAGKALRAVPEVNCYYDPRTDAVKPNASVDVSVAVATDGGLITPIVKGADVMGLAAINDTVKDLAARARVGKLKPEEFQGGSFTISNLGMFGIDDFTAVINPPQAAILAVGRGEKKVVGAPIKGEADLDTPADALPAPTIATMMTVQLSSDARVVDAALAAQFLQVFKHYIQNPQLLVA